MGRADTSSAEQHISQSSIFHSLGADFATSGQDSTGRRPKPCRDYFFYDSQVRLITKE